MSEPAGRHGAALRAVAFDFDGVILESGRIKQQAFLDLFAHRPEHADGVVAHHLENLGVSRYDKIEWIHRELLGRTLTSEELAEEGRRYSALVLEHVLACPLVAGAKELLHRLQGRVHCFVVSATPQEELELIVERRGLRPYFRELHGAPSAKAEVLLDLLDRYRLAAETLVMVGDGHSDYRAARSAGVPFILRWTDEQAELFRDVQVERVHDLAELAVLLERRLPVRETRPAGVAHDPSGGRQSAG